MEPGGDLVHGEVVKLVREGVDVLDEVADGLAHGLVLPLRRLVALVPLLPPNSHPIPIHLLQ